MCDLGLDRLDYANSLGAFPGEEISIDLIISTVAWKMLNQWGWRCASSHRQETYCVDLALTIRIRYRW
jgi:hypothetical protein